jgi:hypothetical protein
LKRYLVWERPEGSRFGDDAVGGFIERFRATLAYAGVASSDKIEEETDGQDADEDTNRRKDQGTGNSPPPKWSKSTAVKMRELPITLPSLNVAVVTVPETMTEADFQMLATMINAWKSALVAPQAASQKTSVSAVGGASDGDEST